MLERHIMSFLFRLKKESQNQLRCAESDEMVEVVRVDGARGICNQHRIPGVVMGTVVGAGVIGATAVGAVVVGAVAMGASVVVAGIMGASVVGVGVAGAVLAKRYSTYVPCRNGNRTAMKPSMTIRVRSTKDQHDKAYAQHIHTAHQTVDGGMGTGMSEYAAEVCGCGVCDRTRRRRSQCRRTGRRRG